MAYIVFIGLNSGFILLMLEFYLTIVARYCPYNLQHARSFIMSVIEIESLSASEEGPEKGEKGKGGGGMFYNYFLIQLKGTCVISLSDIMLREKKMD